MKLVEDPLGSVADAVLVYRAREHSFATEPRPTGADTSLSVNDLALMVDGTNNRVLFVNGFSPRQSWEPASLPTPPFRRASLVVETESELPPGVSTRLSARDEPWPVQVDSHTGWVRLARPLHEWGAARASVEFAPGCLAVLDDGELIELWLHPEQLPSESS